MLGKQMVGGWASTAGTGGAGRIYLSVEILIDLDSSPKGVDILHNVGELPHIPNPVQQAPLGGLRRLNGLHLLPTPLTRHHSCRRSRAADVDGDGGIGIDVTDVDSGLKLPRSYARACFLAIFVPN